MKLLQAYILVMELYRGNGELVRSAQLEHVPDDVPVATGSLARQTQRAIAVDIVPASPSSAEDEPDEPQLPEMAIECTEFFPDNSTSESD